MRIAIFVLITGATGCAHLSGQQDVAVAHRALESQTQRVSTGDTGRDEYLARRDVLAQCEGHGELPSETPTLPMPEALADVSRRIQECQTPSTARAARSAPEVEIERRVEEVRTPVEPIVRTEPERSAPVPTPPPSPLPLPRGERVGERVPTRPAEELEAAEPIPEFPQELLDEVRRTLHRAIDGEAPPASVTALARSLHSMEEGEKDAVLECIEESGSRVRSERESDRRLRRLRQAVRNCISPPEPEATPGQLAEVAEGIMADTVGTGGSPRGQSYSAALDGVGFVDFYPYRWKNAGRRRVSIRNSSNFCFLEVQLDGASVRMVMGETPVLAPVEGRPGTFVPVIPPNRVGSYVLPDDEWHPQRLICHQGTIDELGPAGTIVRLNGQLVMMASSGPVRPVESRESEVRAGPFGGPRSISEFNMHRIASRE